MTKLFLVSAFFVLFSLCLSACGASQNSGGAGGVAKIGTIGNAYEERDLSEREKASLGDARISFRQYAAAGVVGANGSRPSDHKEILVNHSHSAYDNGSNEKLRQSEFYISDSVMLQLLNEFRAKGYFDTNRSNVRIVDARMTLEAYAQRISGIFKWIAVEHGGKTYMITRTSKEHLTTREAHEVQTFNECEYAIFRASNNKMLKASVREVSAEDLRRRREDLNRNRNAQPRRD
ncbi:MAG: hypothetical protein KDB07_03370 [Planctomycetes bacterium]|nr:hypothetical protein [Planctomycetota bacterium]